MSRLSIEDRRQRVVELYPLDRTLESIGDELGVSGATIKHDVDFLVEAGHLKKRPRGAMISVAMDRWWASEAGQQERASRRSDGAASELRRSDGKPCASCGEITVGKYCAPCLSAIPALRAELADRRLKQMRVRRGEWQEKVAKLKAEADYAGIEAVIKALPRELRRSQGAVSGHIAAGGLVPTPNDLGLLLFTQAAVDNYIVWLREHPDGRLSRFNVTSVEAARFRGRWFAALMNGRGLHHLVPVGWGRVNWILAPAKPHAKKAGAPGHLDDAGLREVRDLKNRDLSERQIAREMNISRGAVQYALRVRIPELERTEGF